MFKPLTKRIEIGQDLAGFYNVFRYGVYVGEIKQIPAGFRAGIGNNLVKFGKFTDAVRHTLRGNNE